MAAKKKAQIEADLGTPDVSKQPEAKSFVKEPSPLIEKVDNVLREIKAIIGHKDFPQELRADIDPLTLKLMVVKFKVAASQ